jgi:hypothetical protein
VPEGPHAMNMGTCDWLIILYINSCWFTTLTSILTKFPLLLTVKIIDINEFKKIFDRSVQNGFLQKIATRKR